jgi:antitoxin HicB
MKTYTYTIHIEVAEEGGFIVNVPALSGCVTQGETYDEAVSMAHEAIEGYVEALVKAGEPIPEEKASFTSYLTVRVPAVA